MYHHYNYLTFGSQQKNEKAGEAASGLNPGSGGFPPPFQTIPLSVIATLALKIYFIESLGHTRRGCAFFIRQNSVFLDVFHNIAGLAFK